MDEVKAAAICKHAELTADNIECASQVPWQSESHRRDAIRNIRHGIQRALDSLMRPFQASEAIVEPRPDVFNFVCEHLPDGWKITIEMEKNAGSVQLFNNDGNPVDEFADDGLFVDFILDRVNHAREAGGLSRINWDCQQKRGT